jgi:flagellar biosynthesis protein FliQ
LRWDDEEESLMETAASPDYFIGVAQQALWVLALACSPVLVPALVAGLVLGMIQAATSINEATLSFVPKLIVVGLCLVLFGGAMLMLMADFTRDMFARIPDVVR